MSQKRKLLSNSFSMAINRLTQGIITFVLSAAIARNLGVYSLGQYLLAIGYYYIFVSLSSQGLKTLFTREVARDLQSTPVYLVSGTLLQLIFSIFGYGLLVLTIYLLPYSDHTSSICYILGLAVIPFSLSNITESIFQAQEKMHLIAISTVPIYILRLLAMLWVMPVTRRIEDVAIILVISESLILAIQWLLLVRIVQPKWQIDRHFMWDTVNNAKTLFAIEGIGMIAGKIDMLILSLLGSEVLVGLYGSVMQLMQPVSILFNSLTLSAFPGMSKAVEFGRERQRQEAENIIKILLSIGLPFAIGMMFFGRDLLLLIYQKQSFLEASILLNLISIAICSTAFSQTFSYVLLANGLEKFNLIEVVITGTVGGISGVFLISQYQLLGAALMSLTMSVTNLSVMGYAVCQRIFVLRLWDVLKLPLLISAVMSTIYAILDKIDLDFSITLSVCVCAYAIVSGAIVAFKLGGVESVRQKISKFRS
jgi:O-antigen/teichoic acid export membrane protein